MGAKRNALVAGGVRGGKRRPFQLADPASSSNQSRSVIVVGGHSPSDPMKTPSSNQRFFQSISFGDCAGWTKTVQPKQKDPTISKTRGAAYVPPTRDCSLWLSHA
ncbi:hypothetical protein THAOC_12743 [Thalassiosira oceanica]|uniref:Uncharacterized protein n=1 Tax=Thalassiosira oceanica TaxID=159749 RepID=K0SLZ0_THAOC|nr:hypothetical protein THAOC_12743 [Thalassiosira oceanica]|eukprot:EJK66345.1 hypothetical protein THAOC_12743 [Thalassiosira oceanica]